MKTEAGGLETNTADSVAAAYGEKEKGLEWGLGVKKNFSVP